MRTKQEILDEVSKGEHSIPTFKAMDEYAKEVSFEFYKWVNKGRYWQHSNGVWYKGSHMSECDPYLTNEQLFERYQQEKRSA